MVFSDEDLKRLKEDIQLTGVGPRPSDALALIARLEAAEKVIEVAGSDPLSGEVSKSFEEWRKAAGK